MPKSVFMRKTADKDPESEKRKPFRASRLIGLDAWIDSTLYSLRYNLGEWWENITIFSRRFRVRGFRRFVVEVLDEGFTLGVGGAVLMLVLALPALPSSIATAMKSASAAFCIVRPCPSTNCRITSSRLCSAPRTGASSTTTALISGA